MTGTQGMLAILPYILVCLPGILGYPTTTMESIPNHGNQDLHKPGSYLLKALPNPAKYSDKISTEKNNTISTGLIKAVNFMKQFGYVPAGDDSSDFIYSKESLREKLKLVQKFGAIPQTGELDQATIELMNAPRCGVRDVDSESGRRRRKRYIVGGDGWNKRKLTYHLANWSPQLKSKENVQQELKKAFDHWSKYSYLQFTEVENNDADIIIFFASYDHLDGYPFEGEGGILAHAYYPYEFGHYGGDIHFDESETWNIAPKDEYSGLDFFTVAVHEIGHSLGLAHSPVASSIMFPYYKGREDHFTLDYDDVMGMWELYIRRTLEGDEEFFNTTTTTTTTTPRPPYDGTQNDDGSWTNDDDDVRYAGDSETVDDHLKRTDGSTELPPLPPLFPEGEPTEDDFYAQDRKRREEEQKRREEEKKRKREEEEAHRRWEEERRRHEEEIRRREEEERRKWEEENERRRKDWERRWSTTERPTTLPPTTAKPVIPDVCDGDFDSVAYIRNHLFIFKGKYLWRFYDQGQPVDGYPTKIETMFPGLPYWIKKIDAAYERRNDSNIIFFIGKYYYVHDGSQLVENSPKPLTDLGLPERITQVDAALFWPKNNKTYLFSRNLYWRRDDFLDHMEDNYPRGIERWNGIPKYLDAAVTDKKDISYFIKHKDVYEYDNIKITPTYDSPKSIRAWTNC